MEDIDANSHEVQHDKDVDPRAISRPDVVADIDYMMRNGVDKAVFKGADGGAVHDGAGRPISKLDFSFGKEDQQHRTLVLSLSFPEFDDKPSEDSRYLDITMQFQGFRLKGPPELIKPELIENGRKIKIGMIGPNNKAIQITAEEWSYYRGLHI